MRAMSADAIVANSGTITGSIGVVTWQAGGPASQSRLFSGPIRAHQPQRRCVVVTSLSTYAQHRMSMPRPACLHDFVARVSQCRKMTVEAVDSIPRPGVDGAYALGTGWWTSSAACAPRSPRQVLAGWIPTPTSACRLTSGARS